MRKLWPVILITVPAIILIWVIVPYNNYLLAKAKKAVIGLIMGEVVALMAWNLFAAIRAAMGLLYHRVEILPK